MPQSYSIVTTAGLQNLAGSRSEWTYAAVNEELANSKTLLSAFYGETGESLAATLPLYMLPTFVDYEECGSSFRFCGKQLRSFIFNEGTAARADSVHGGKRAGSASKGRNSLRAADASLAGAVCRDGRAV